MAYHTLVRISPHCSAAFPYDTSPPILWPIVPLSGLARTTVPLSLMIPAPYLMACHILIRVSLHHSAAPRMIFAPSLVICSCHIIARVSPRCRVASPLMIPAQCHVHAPL